MDNRRTADRRHTVYHSQVTDVATGDLIGYMVDVSSTGIRLMAPAAVETGRVLDLQVDLPRPLLGKETMTFSVVVRWCGPCVNPDYMALGLEVLAPSDQQTAILNTLQGSLCFDR